MRPLECLPVLPCPTPERRRAAPRSGVERVADEDRLEAAFARVRARGPRMPGADGVTLAQLAARWPRERARLAHALRSGAYVPRPLRPVTLRPEGRRERTLALPSMCDRVVEAAVLSVVRPRIERLLDDAAFAYRPGRSVAAAIDRLRAAADAGRRVVLRGDVAAFFDRVPHARLLDRLDEALADPPLVALVARLVALPMQDRAPTGCRGLPQGSALSPLLSNLYLTPFDRAFARAGLVLVRYADDFAVACRSDAAAHHARTLAHAELQRLGLSLHPGKTRIEHLDRGVSFLGHRLSRPTGAASVTVVKVPRSPEAPEVPSAPLPAAPAGRRPPPAPGMAPLEQRLRAAMAGPAPARPLPVGPAPAGPAPVGLAPSPTSGREGGAGGPALPAAAAPPPRPTGGAGRPPVPPRGPHGDAPGAGDAGRGDGPPRPNGPADAAPGRLPASGEAGGPVPRVLYVDTQGATLSVERGRFVVVRPGTGEVLARMGVDRVGHVVLFGTVHVTHEAQRRALAAGIGVSLLTRTGRLTGHLVAPAGAARRLRRQCAAASTPDARRVVARSLVVAKLRASRRLVQQRARALAPDSRAAQGAAEAVRRLGAALRAARQAPSLAALRGVEGAAAAAYWGAFRHLVRPDDMPFTGRSKRPPADAVNALLSFAYALAHAHLRTLCEVHGLHPHVGFLHEDAPGHATLASDLLEPARPTLDAFVLRLVNRRVFTPLDFVGGDPDTPASGTARTTTGVRLTDAARVRFLTAFEAEMRRPRGRSRRALYHRLAATVQRLARHLDPLPP